MPPNYSYTDIKDANNIVYEKIISPSTIETIDKAFYDYINNKVNLSATSKEGFKKTPVLWGSTERSFQIKSDLNLRDENGSLNLPLISVMREGLEKDPSFKGAFQAHFPEGPGPKRLGVPIARRILHQKTSEFISNDTEEYIEGILKKDPRYIHSVRSGDDINTTLNNTVRTLSRNNNKVVYQTVYAPIPVYVKVMYNVKFKTNYQTNMNELITPFITLPGQINAINISSDGHRYEGFVEGNVDSTNPTNFESEERIFESNIKFRILGYLMGQDTNDDRPRFSVVENVVEVKIPRERVITNDKNITSKKSFYI